MLLVAYNTFVPFSFTGESSSSSTIYYTSHVGLRCDNTPLGYRVSRPVVSSLQDTAA